MTFTDKVKRSWFVVQAVSALGGAAQAPPPADMPHELQRQYAAATKVRLEQHRREVQRLTAKDGGATTSLSRAEAKRVRGKR